MNVLRRLFGKTSENPETPRNDGDCANLGMPTKTPGADRRGGPSAGDEHSAPAATGVFESETLRYGNHDLGLSEKLLATYTANTDAFLSSPNAYLNSSEYSLHREVEAEIRTYIENVLNEHPRGSNEQFDYDYVIKDSIHVDLWQLSVGNGSPSQPEERVVDLFIRTFKSLDPHLASEPDDRIEQAMYQVFSRRLDHMGQLPIDPERFPHELGDHVAFLLMTGASNDSESSAPTSPLA